MDTTHEPPTASHTPFGSHVSPSETARRIAATLLQELPTGETSPSGQRTCEVTFARCTVTESAGSVCGALGCTTQTRLYTVTIPEQQPRTLCRTHVHEFITTKLTL